MGCAAQQTIGTLKAVANTTAQTTDKVNVGGHFFFKKALKSK